MPGPIDILLIVALILGVIVYVSRRSGRRED